MSSLLDETLEAWRDVRDGLIDEVRNIPARHFDFRPTPEVRSVRELVQHILEATTKGELVKLLRSQMRDAERRFREAGELSLYQLITRFDGEPGTKFTWLQHGIAQEMYHRGQLTLYARLLGLEPALTRRIRGG
jgi:uncharacterized damage-inducible protein DinB